MELLQSGEITIAAGLAGDHKGARFPERAITILAVEDWRDAVSMIIPGHASTDVESPEEIPWTVRRANLLVEGLRLPRATGSILEIGAVTLEVTRQTYPCRRMDEAHPGLMKALARNWRGGLTTRVVQPGVVQIGDGAVIVRDMREIQPRLP